MLWKSALAILVALALAGCSSSGSGKPNANVTGTTQIAAQPGDQLPVTTDIPQTLDPCTLLTLPEAIELAAGPVTRTAGGGPGSLNCVYTHGTTRGAEVSVKVDSDAATAHKDFPSWVQPIPGATATGLVVTKIKNLGDEATLTRNGVVNDGIYVRRGAALIKIGADPSAPTGLLMTAARTALTRVHP
jgi:hypothetical protein